MHHSYFLGCSTGGREGMIMAQRYPQLRCPWPTYAHFEGGDAADAGRYSCREP